MKKYQKSNSYVKNAWGNLQGGKVIILGQDFLGEKFQGTKFQGMNWPVTSKKDSEL